MRRVLILGSVALLIAATSVAVQGYRYAQASAIYDRASRSSQHTAHQINRVKELRSQAERVSIGQRPTAGIDAAINQAMRSASIPTTKLQSVAPQSDVALRSRTPSDNAQQYRTQTVRVSFNQLDMSQLGRFLHAWHQIDHPWAVSSIELTQSRAQQAGGDAYDTRMYLTAIYIPSQPTREN